MLRRAQCVPISAFPAILKHGKIKHSSFLSLRFLTQPGVLFKAKFSVVVSSKVSKSAVERNLWKRRSCAVVRKFEKQIKNNHCCLLFLKPTVQTLSFSQLSEKIKDIFYQAKLIVLKP